MTTKRLLATTDENSALGEGLRNGSPEAFERLYREQGGRMKSIAANLLGNRSEAEDAVHETFIKIYRAGAGFDGRCAPHTWALRILINTCHDWLRMRRRLTAVEDLATPPRDNIALRAALEKAIGLLNVRQRTVFLLFAVEGLRHAEIAEIMEEPEGTIRSVLHDARQALRATLRPAGASL